MHIFLDNKVATLFRSGKSKSVGRIYSISEIKYNLQMDNLYLKIKSKSRISLYAFQKQNTDYHLKQTSHIQPASFMF